MRSLILLTSVFLFCCSKKIIKTKPLDTLNEKNVKKKNVKNLCGKIIIKPKLEKFSPTILILEYNDKSQTKISSYSDFDNKFCFYDFKKKILNKKSSIKAFNIGCKTENIYVNDLKNHIIINLHQDSINGISLEKYNEILKTNKAID